MLAINQGSPRPRNTLTALLPLMFPTELSAKVSCSAACRLANVSGMLVPKATNVMAVIRSFKPIRQPKIEAMSPTMAVRRPMNNSENVKVSHPPPIVGGGMKANNTYKIIQDLIT